jgi:membrane protein insertase Oxa1/YidC/SpoIIIJ
LVLYWLVGNIVGFTQQFLINRWTKDDDEPESTPVTPVKKSPPPKKPISSATART